MPSSENPPSALPETPYGLSEVYFSIAEWNAARAALLPAATVLSTVANELGLKFVSSKTYPKLELRRHGLKRSIALMLHLLPRPRREDVMDLQFELGLVQQNRIGPLLVGSPTYLRLALASVDDIQSVDRFKVLIEDYLTLLT